MSLVDLERAWRDLLLAKDAALMPGADEARQGVYRRLVRGNLTGSVKRGVPILRKMIGEPAVEALAARFLDEVGVKTRLVRFVPVEFAQWLMELPPQDLPHPAAGELAHWEALEIDVIMAPDADARPTSTLTDDKHVDMHPSARLAAYRHAVHAMTTSSTQWPTSPAATSEPYILLAWRHGERFTWTQLDGGTAKVLVESSGGATIGDAIARVRAALVEGDALDVPRVRAALVDLQRRGAIAAFRASAR